MFMSLMPVYGGPNKHMHKGGGALNSYKFLTWQTLIKLLCLLKEHKKRLPTFQPTLIINAHKRRCVHT